MSTRSMIALQKEDGTLEAVYCHYDGYPAGVGKTLREHYQDLDKVRALIRGGGMSCLGEGVEDCEYFTKRGEKLKIYSGLNQTKLAKKAKDVWCEYLYVYDPTRDTENKWLVTDLHN